MKHKAQASLLAFALITTQLEHLATDEMDRATDDGRDYVCTEYANGQFKLEINGGESYMLASFGGSGNGLAPKGAIQAVIDFVNDELKPKIKVPTVEVTSL